MGIKAKLNNLRIAPRKVRQAADLVRGKKVVEARSLLLFTTNKPAKSVLKLLNSATASAKHDFHLEESKLFISKITVDEGIKMKRWHPMSRGRAYPIMKRTSHINLILSEINQKKSSEEQTKILRSKTQISNKKPKAKKKKV